MNSIQQTNRRKKKKEEEKRAANQIRAGEFDVMGGENRN
jgi:hypothetical protein